MYNFRITLKNAQYALILTLLIYSFISLCMNSPANDINIPYEWYHYQGASDAVYPSRDCGTACISMAIKYVKNTFVPITLLFP